MIEHQSKLFTLHEMPGKSETINYTKTKRKTPITQNAIDCMPKSKNGMIARENLETKIIVVISVKHTSTEKKHERHSANMDKSSI